MYHVNNRADGLKELSALKKLSVSLGIVQYPTPYTNKNADGYIDGSKWSWQVRPPTRPIDDPY